MSYNKYISDKGIKTFSKYYLKEAIRKTLGTVLWTLHYIIHLKEDKDVNLQCLSITRIFERLKKLTMNIEYFIILETLPNNHLHILLYLPPKYKIVVESQKIIKEELFKLSYIHNNQYKRTKGTFFISEVSNSYHSKELCSYILKQFNMNKLKPTSLFYYNTTLHTEITTKLEELYRIIITTQSKLEVKNITGLSENKFRFLTDNEFEGLKNQIKDLYQEECLREKLNDFLFNRYKLSKLLRTTIKSLNLLNFISDYFILLCINAHNNSFYNLLQPLVYIYFNHLNLSDNEINNLKQDYFKSKLNKNNNLEEEGNHILNTQYKLGYFLHIMLQECFFKDLIIKEDSLLYHLINLEKDSFNGIKCYNLEELEKLSLKDHIKSLDQLLGNIYNKTRIEVNHLSLLFPPKRWEFSSETKEKVSGKKISSEIYHYLTNKYDYKFLMVESRDNDLLIDSNLLEIVNKLNHIPFGINKNILRLYLLNNFFLFVNNLLPSKIEDLKENTISGIEYNHLCSLEKKDKIIYYLNIKNKYNSKYYTHKALKEEFKLYLELFNTDNDTDLLLFYPFRLDFRHRISQITTYSPLSNKELRALIRNWYLLPINYNAYKQECVKSYTNEKMSDVEKLEFYNNNLEVEIKKHIKELELILNQTPSLSLYYDIYFGDKTTTFDINFSTSLKKFIIESESPFKFLDCLTEYLSIQSHLNKGKGIGSYLTTFLCSKDATSSGNQIISYIMNNSLYKKELNLDTYSKSRKPLSFYSEICSNYLNKGCSLAIKEMIYKLLNNKDDLKISKYLTKVFKNLLMKGVYGGTYDTFYKDTQSFLLSNKLTIDFTELHIIVKDIYNFTKNEVPFYRLNLLLNKLVSLWSEFNLNWEYETLIGGKVVCGYLINKKERYYVTYGPGKRTSITFNKKTDKKDFKKMKQASCANFLHSLDSSLILESYNRSTKSNKYYSSRSVLLIHDSFLVPSIETEVFTDTIRETFIDLFSDKDFINKFVLDNIDLLVEKLNNLILNIELKDIKPSKKEIEKINKFVRNKKTIPAYNSLLYLLEYYKYSNINYSELKKEKLLNKSNLILYPEYQIKNEKLHLFD